MSVLGVHRGAEQLRSIDRIESERDEARAERDDARAERDEARAERDEARRQRTIQGQALNWTWQGNLASEEDQRTRFLELIHVAFEPTPGPDIQKARVYGTIDGVRHEFRWSVRTDFLPAECDLRPGHPANVLLFARAQQNMLVLGTSIETALCYVADEQFIQFHRPKIIENREHSVELTVTGANAFSKSVRFVVIVRLDNRIEWRPIGMTV